MLLAHPLSVKDVRSSPNFTLIWSLNVADSFGNPKANPDLESPEAVMAMTHRHWLQPRESNHLQALGHFRRSALRLHQTSQALFGR